MGICCSGRAKENEDNQNMDNVHSSEALRNRIKEQTDYIHDNFKNNVEEINMRHIYMENIKLMLMDFSNALLNVDSDEAYGENDDISLLTGRQKLEICNFMDEIEFINKEKSASVTDNGMHI